MLSAMQYFVDKFFLFSAILTMAYFGTLSGVGVKSNTFAKDIFCILIRMLICVCRAAIIYNKENQFVQQKQTFGRKRLKMKSRGYPLP